MSVAKYIATVTSEAAHGVAETTHYAALKELLNAAGDELTPKVRALIHPKGTGVGIPDGELWTAGLLPKPGQEALDLFAPKDKIPDRGGLEAKPLDADLDRLKGTDQVRKYLGRYRQMLLTNLREFAVVQMRDGAPTVIERYPLADTPKAFLAMTEADAKPHERPLKEFLRRALRAQVAIDTPGELAFSLASHARTAKAQLDSKGDIDDLNRLKEALESALGIRFAAGEGDAFFRAQLVETLFYGLFSAWVLWHEERPGRSDAFTYSQTSEYLSVPVIDRLYNAAASKRILEKTGLRHALRNAADVLNRVNRPLFFEAFRDGAAVQYFYEPFLAQFDADLRKQLGVWYTPPEIVQGMVAKCDRLLMDVLGEPDGLASDGVLVLDPCCGTGAFLVEALRVAAERWKGRGEPYADRLRRAATERMFGFELLTGPFVVAHLQVAFLLAHHGVRLEGDERAAVYLTNALTGWEPVAPEKRALDPLALYAESDRAHEVKRKEPILVVLGNPPYSGYAGIAQMDEEREIADRYRPEKSRGQGLNDLYVRFFAMADRRIRATGKGLVCFISNYSWLEGLSFAKMRESFLTGYDRIWIDNLHGDKYATGKTTPMGDPDPSAFSTETNREGIQIGTAVATLIRREGSHSGVAEVWYRDFWGVSKRADYLANTGEYVLLVPSAALGHPLRPREVEATYLSWPRFPELVPFYLAGVETKRDDFLVSIDEKPLRERIRTYFDVNVSNAEIRRLYPTVMKQTGRFDPETTRATLRARGMLSDNIVRESYRPFDVRYVYWEPETRLLGEKVPRSFPLSKLQGQYWVTTQQKVRRAWHPPIGSRVLADRHLNEWGASNFPLFIGSEKGSDALQMSLLEDPAGAEEQAFNLSPLAWDALRTHGLEDRPETVFFHALATMHAPAYAAENAGALRQDWPRVPLGLGSAGPKSQIMASPLGEGRVGVESLTPSPRPEASGGQNAADPHPTLPQGGGHDLEGGRKEPLGAAGEGPSPSPLPLSPGRERGSGDATREWLLRGAELGRRVAALLDIETPVRGVDAGDLDPALREVAPYRMADGSEPRERTDDVALRGGWGYRGQGGVVMPGPDGSVARGDGTRDVVANPRARWTGVPEAVWAYHLGGYQVLKKWLSYREEKVLGRPLTLEEVRTFTAICRRIAALLALGPELDAHYRAAAGLAMRSTESKG